MVTMEQSNLGSKPRKPAVGAADRGHNPLYLKKPEPLPIALLKDPRSRWPGTSIREKWALWLGILEDLPGMGQEMSLGKDLRKLWKNPPHRLSCMKRTWEGMELGNKYSWVFVKNLKIFSMCTKILLAYFVWGFKGASILISCVP